MYPRDVGPNMKRIGLLGGMSWESSAEYYRFVNEEVRARLGGLHSGDCVLRSVDFADVEQMQREGRWEEAGLRLAGGRQRTGTFDSRTVRHGLHDGAGLLRRPAPRRARVKRDRAQGGGSSDRP
jgi:hypothetical protein